MAVILGYLLGTIVFLIGICLTQYCAMYSVEVFSKKEPNFSINPVMWLLAVLAYGLICWSFLIYGCSYLLSFLVITPIIYSSVFAINHFIASKSNKVDKVIMIIIFILLMLGLIFLWYHAITMSPGIEEEVDKSLGIK